MEQTSLQCMQRYYNIECVGANLIAAVITLTKLLLLKQAVFHTSIDEL
jgi:hypothetical protein